MSTEMRFFTGPATCSITKCPTGVYAFVGSVPLRLAFVFDDIKDAKAAAKFGLGLVQKAAEANGRTIRTRVFDTKKDALDFAHTMGIEVNE
jgi:hypothetical protein